MHDALEDARAGAAAALVDAAREAMQGVSWWHETEVRELEAVRAIRDAPEDVRRACFFELVDRNARSGFDGGPLLAVLAVVARKRLALSPRELESLVTTMAGPETKWGRRSETVRAVSRQIEHAYPQCSDAERARLAPVVERLAAESRDAPTATRLRKLLGDDAGRVPIELIEESDDVGPRLRRVFEQSAETPEALAAAVGLFAAFPQTGRPAKKWQAECERVRGALREPRALVAALLDAALEADDMNDGVTPDFSIARFLQPATELFLCGVAAFAGVVAEPGLLPQLRRLAVKSITAIGSGVYKHERSVRLANACVQAMADIGAPSSITELLALERSVRHGALLRQIRKAIDGLAAAEEVTRDELLERAVEDHGLDADGRREVALARGSALIEVDARGATMVYADEAGARKTSFPADVKAENRDALATLRTDVKTIRKTVAAERHRLDGLMAVDRRWPFAQWQALYLDHPITGRLARTLIWGFRADDGSDVVGIAVDPTRVVTSAGEEVEVPAGAEVRLWHPIHADQEEVHTWRRHLLERLIVQPFKQAWRELYVVTWADRQRKVYSNRFAGHVFRQVQARALMKGRGWQPVPVAVWDDGIEHGVARRLFEPFAVRAEFFFDPILDIDPTDGALYPYCTSDQVRFFRGDGDDAIALEDVPLVVFSEAMRDVDLFVSVTSIAADPDWLDRGKGRRFVSYVQEFCFGPLREPAELRREALAQLVPLLSIADRCTLEDRYLTVRGDLRTYRIHLGSGHVVLPPNDRALRIRARRDRRLDRLYVPFDDDPVLDLILSRAYMLADDAKIRDPAVVRQIERGQL